MRIALFGPGRAGTAVCLAARRAGHTVVSVTGRRPEATNAAAVLLASTALTPRDPITDADLLIIAVRDDAIESVAAEIDPNAPAVVHLSGAVGLQALRSLAERGVRVGSLHPLQTLPDPQTGAEALSGSWMAVTTSSAELRTELEVLARSIGAVPFALADDNKALYHAAAAAAANFPLAVLTMAKALEEKAGVPWEAARPLVEAVVANAFDIGPRAALTGPVARGDVGTVRRQLSAVAAAAPEWHDLFSQMVTATARIAGTSDQIGGLEP